MTKRRLTVLGATGSNGASTLDVAGRHPERYRVHALTAHRSADALLALCLRHAPEVAVLSGLEEEAGLRRRVREGRLFYTTVSGGFRSHAIPLDAGTRRAGLAVQLDGRLVVQPSGLERERANPS